MGALQWTPTEFWRSTPADLIAASAGWRKAHGMQENVAGDMTVDELIEAYDEMMRESHGR